MNIEKLQKMNELAKELKSHGLAQSMDDAYTQADSMINNGSYVEIRNVMEGNSPIANSIVEERRISNHVVELNEKLVTQNSKIEQMNSVIMKMQEVMNDMISEVVKLKEHKSIVNGVSSVINPGTTSFSQAQSSAAMEPARSMAASMAVPTSEIIVERQQAQRAVERAVESPIEAPRMNELRIPQSQSSPQQSSQAENMQRRGMYAEKSDDANHPRQGSYTPMDVSIEKFFNVNKR